MLRFDRELADRIAPRSPPKLQRKNSPEKSARDVLTETP